MSWLAPGPICVIRGGSWSGDPQLAQVAGRGSFTPGFRYFNLGFRLMRRCT